MPNVFRYQDFSFQQVPGDLASIAVGSANNIWGRNISGKAVRYDATSNKFSLAAGNKVLRSIAVGATDVWGIDPLRRVYRYDRTSKAFKKVGGSLDYIGVPILGGTPWGRLGGTILRYSQSSEEFKPMATGFNSLSVGMNSTEVWALDADGWPFRWLSNKFVKNSKETVRLKSVIPSATFVYGVGKTGATYRAEHQPQQVTLFSGKSNLIKGNLELIDTGALDFESPQGGGTFDSAWGLNATGKAYQLTMGKWIHRGGPFSKIAVGIGSSTEGLAGDGKTPMTFNDFNIWALK